MTQSETASGGLRGETGMKWPQFVMAGLLLADVGLSCALHGEPKEGKYDAGVTIIANLIMFGRPRPPQPMRSLHVRGWGCGEAPKGPRGRGPGPFLEIGRAHV